MDEIKEKELIEFTGAKTYNQLLWLHESIYWWMKEEPVNQSTILSFDFIIKREKVFNLRNGSEAGMNQIDIIRVKLIEMKINWTKQFLNWFVRLIEFNQQRQPIQQSKINSISFFENGWDGLICLLTGIAALVELIDCGLLSLICGLWPPPAAMLRKEKTNQASNQFKDCSLLSLPSNKFLLFDWEEKWRLSWMKWVVLFLLLVGYGRCQRQGLRQREANNNNNPQFQFNKWLVWEWSDLMEWSEFGEMNLWNEFMKQMNANGIKERSGAPSRPTAR